MNSLNILSARVIGSTPPQIALPGKASRSRSVSEGVRNKVASYAPKRSASQHEKAGYPDRADEKSLEFIKQEGEVQDGLQDALRAASEQEPPEADLVDEKTLLLDDYKAESDLGIRQSKSRLRLVTKRLIDALTESIKWVISKLVAPGVYLVACFHDSEGRFSPLLPMRKGRCRNPNRNGSASTTRAIGLSGSPDPLSPSFKLKPSNKTAQTKSSGKNEKSRNADAISLSSSDSEVDLRSKTSSHSRDSRPKLNSSSPVEDTTPTRRSIRIKLNNSEAARRRKQKGTHETTIGAVDTGEKSPEIVTPANLKSPTSPASSLGRTRYPRAPAPPRPLIPRRQPSYSTIHPRHYSHTLAQKTLVIDLDETLIHSMAKGGRMSSGHMVEVKLSHPTSYNGLTLGPQHPILYYVHKRPYCDDFLRKVCKWYNLVVFTASVQEYADPVIDWLEQERKYFSARYYRQHCTFRNGAYIKDLSSVEPDLSRVIILDNSPLSYIFHEGKHFKYVLVR